MSLMFYKWLHLGGAGLVLLALGGMAFGRDRKMLSAAHGIGLLITLVAGFGLLARYGISWPWPGWVIAKIVLWVVFGASATALKKLPNLTVAWWALWVLFLIVAYLGVNKPMFGAAPSP